MAVKFNDSIYYLVDVICVDEIIYEVYENDLGEVIYKAIDTTY